MHLLLAGLLPLIPLIVFTVYYRLCYLFTMNVTGYIRQVTLLYLRADGAKRVDKSHLDLVAGLLLQLAQFVCLGSRVFSLLLELGNKQHR